MELSRVFMRGRDSTSNDSGNDQRVAPELPCYAAAREYDIDDLDSGNLRIRATMFARVEARFSVGGPGCKLGDSTSTQCRVVPRHKSRDDMQYHNRLSKVLKWLAIGSLGGCTNHCVREPLEQVLCPRVSTLLRLSLAIRACLLTSGVRLL